ncbi:40S ribosomal protein S12-like [Vitis riparia]|uniref:40S ribosomal protein S12-like n=1 Tax=Vitis riparia TaxID=96939 RepID=UPI00155ABAFF|nr:40S ribosomal protein S12-like [Vitis riparia]
MLVVGRGHAADARNSGASRSLPRKIETGEKKGGFWLQAGDPELRAEEEKLRAEESGDLQRTKTISDREDRSAVVDEAAGAPLGETLDLMTALQFVLRKSLAHGGLVRGHHEGAKVIEKHAAQLCVLADDCNQPGHIKRVTALRADHNVSLKSVPSAKTLGE